MASLSMEIMPSAKVRFAMGRKVLLEIVGDIFPTLVIAESLNAFAKLCLDISMEVLKCLECLTLGLE